MHDSDRLLYFLTARGLTRMPALRDVIAQLSSGDKVDCGVDPLRVYKLCRLLDMLGHAEHHRGRPGWLSVAPPYLAKLPILGKERCVLTGARTAATADDIRSEVASASIRCSIVESNHRSTEPLLPRRIVYEFEEPDDSRKLAHRLGIGYSSTLPTWALACFSQGLSEFEEKLQWHPRNASLSGVHLFDPNRLAFVYCDRLPDGPFLCRSTADVSLVLAVNKDHEARIEDPDWGRYWALAKACVAAVEYDRRKRLIAVPAVAPLPRLLARALCLGSGEAPRLIVGDRRTGLRDYLVFCDIPPEIADKVAQRLGVGFAPQTINIPDTDRP
jgi:hypothetical protein